MSNKVSVVILNWNGSKMLHDFLPSVIRFSQGEDIDICVADNGSTDDSVAMLQKEFPTVRLITFDKNYGFAEGYNKALSSIDSEYAVLLNSDVEVTSEWLTPLVDYMDHHPEVCACQPKICSYYHKEQFEYAGAAGGYIDKYGYPFCRGRLFNIVEKDNGQYDSPKQIFWASGAALFIRLKDFFSVGGLDASFFAHMEEIDLCWRLNLYGHSIVCIPQSVVYHVGGATLKKENPYKTFLNFRNNLIMLYKNLPQKRIKKVMLVRQILDYMAALLFLLKGQVPNMFSVFKARKEFKKIRHHYDNAREEINQHRTCSKITTQLDKNILVEFHLLRHHTFDKLRWND